MWGICRLADTVVPTTDTLPPPTMREDTIEMLWSNEIKILGSIIQRRIKEAERKCVFLRVYEFIVFVEPVVVLCACILLLMETMEKEILPPNNLAESDLARSRNTSLGPASMVMSVLPLRTHRRTWGQAVLAPIGKWALMNFANALWNVNEIGQHLMPTPGGMKRIMKVLGCDTIVLILAVSISLSVILASYMR
jgi:hypothetical protein